LFIPAYFGALPWVGSKTAMPVPKFAPAPHPDPHQPGTQVADDITVKIGQDHNVKALRLLKDAGAKVVYNQVVKLDFG